MRHLYESFRDDPDSVYCKQIQMLVDLKASFISRIFQLSGFALAILDNNGGTNFWEDIEQIVKDINRAYDCAGLRRPIIQGGIWEVMNGNICQVQIPGCIIQHFRSAEPNEFLDPSIDSLYQSGIGFHYSRICKPKQVAALIGNCAGDCVPGAPFNNENLPKCGDCEPDITRLETRMFYYYFAKNLIDRGIKGLWIGQQAKIASNDDSNVHLTDVFGYIREYAKSQGAFVVLQGEGHNSEKKGSFSNYAHDSTGAGGYSADQLLFDYQSSSLRPREIFIDDATGSPINVGALNDQNTAYGWGCENSDGSYDPNMFAGTACDLMNEGTMAFIDPCHGPTGLATIGGGISPFGCSTPTPPIVMYFDNGPACYEGIGGSDLLPTDSSYSNYLPRGTQGDYYLLLDKDSVVFGGNSYYKKCDDPYSDCFVKPIISEASVWGWDDQAWFANGFNTNDCRGEWIEKTLRDIKDFSPTQNVFMHMPGRINGLTNHPNCTSGDLDSFYLHEHEDLFNYVDSLLDPIPVTQSSIKWEEKCVRYLSSETCTGNICDVEFQVIQREYRFYVENPDLTSIYSWHFQLKDGSWIPFSYGTERTITIDTITDVRVFLRQDNFGLDEHNMVNNPFGTLTVFIDTVLTPCCPADFELRSGGLNVQVQSQSYCSVVLEVTGFQTNNLSTFFWDTSPYSHAKLEPDGSVIIIYLSGNPYSAPYSVCYVDYVNEEVLTQSGTVPIDPETCDLDFMITSYPNPFNQTNAHSISLFLQGDKVMDDLKKKGGKLTFNVIRNVDGRLVHSFSTDQQQNKMDVSRFKPGLYYVYTTIKGKIFATNFIVIE